MAKIIDKNPYLNTPEKRRAAVIQSVISSSRIEGVYLTEEQIMREPMTKPKRKASPKRAAGKD